MNKYFKTVLILIILISLSGHTVLASKDKIPQITKRQQMYHKVVEDLVESSRKLLQKDVPGNDQGVTLSTAKEMKDVKEKYEKAELTSDTKAYETTRFDILMTMSLLKGVNLCNGTAGIDEKTVPDFIYRLMELGPIKLDRIDSEAELKEPKKDLIEDNELSLSFLFDKDREKMSNNYLKMLAYTSTFVPLITNVYDPSTYELLDDKTPLLDFHITYGWNRKALYRSKSVKAIKNRLADNTVELQPALLSDILEMNDNSELAFYVDTDFYNRGDVESLLPGNSKGKGQSIETTTLDGKLKHNQHNYYIKKDKGKLDEFVTPKMLEELLKNKSYSISRSLAATYAVKEDEVIRKSLNSAISEDNPIFEIAKDYAESNYSIYNSFINYMQVKSLKEKLTNNRAVAVDLDRPVFIDIYGNIVSYSGFVIIPAMSNATLMGLVSDFSPYSIGSLDLLTSHEYEGKMYTNIQNQKFKKYFQTYRGNNKTFVELKSATYEKGDSTVVIDISKFSPADDELKRFIFDNTYKILAHRGQKVYKPYEQLRLAIEVMRGAPIEHIKLEYEGLSNYKKVKHVEICSNMLDVVYTLIGNSTVNILSAPKFKITPQVQFVMLVIFKFIILATVLYLMKEIYIMHANSLFSWSGLAKPVINAILGILLVFLFPYFTQIGFDTPARVLMQEDMLQSSLLEYEKSVFGEELKGNSKQPYTTNSKMYLLLGEQDIDLTKYVTKLSMVSTKELYEELKYDADTEDTISSQLKELNDTVELFGNKIYLPISEVYNSGKVVLKEDNTLVQEIQETNGSNVASFYSPYYYFMDTILQHINEFNSKNKISKTTRNFDGNGNVSGAIAYYFTSQPFYEEFFDVGLNLLFEHEETLGNRPEFESLYINKWYQKGLPEVTQNNIKETLSNKAKYYIASNERALGRISDDVFLKGLCLYLSIEYNKMLGNKYASELHMFNLDNITLLRLIVTPHNKLYMNNSYTVGYSLTREGGLIGVVFGLIDYTLMMCVSYFKFATLLIIGIYVVWSIYIKGLLQSVKDRDLTTNTMGLHLINVLTAMSLLIIVNFSFVLIIKLTLIIPTFKFKVIWNLILLMMGLLFYFLVFYIVMIIIGQDFDTLGVTTITQAITNGMSSLQHTRLVGQRGVSNGVLYDNSNVQYYEEDSSADVLSDLNEADRRFMREVEEYAQRWGYYDAY